MTYFALPLGLKTDAMAQRPPFFDPRLVVTDRPSNSARSSITARESPCLPAMNRDRALRLRPIALQTAYRDSPEASTAARIWSLKRSRLMGSILGDTWRVGKCRLAGVSVDDEPGRRVASGRPPSPGGPL